MSGSLDSWLSSASNSLGSRAPIWTGRAWTTWTQDPSISGSVGVEECFLWSQPRVIWTCLWLIHQPLSPLCHWPQNKTSYRGSAHNTIGFSLLCKPAWTSVSLCLQVSWIHESWFLWYLLGKCLELFSNSLFSPAVPNRLFLFFTVQFLYFPFIYFLLPCCTRASVIILNSSDDNMYFWFPKSGRRAFTI